MAREIEISFKAAFEQVGQALTTMAVKLHQSSGGFRELSEAILKITNAQERREDHMDNQRRHRRRAVPRRVFGRLFKSDLTVWQRYVKAVRHWTHTAIPAERRCVCAECHTARHSLDIRDIERAVSIFAALRGLDFRTGFEALLARERLTEEFLFPAEAVEYILQVLQKEKC